MTQPDPPRDSLLHGDCIPLLDALPARSVDLVFADPPYNLQLKKALYRPNMTKVDAVDDAWDRVGDFEDYDAFTRAWLGACRRVMKPTATLWVSGTYHSIFRVGAIMQDLGFWVLNTVTWHKTNAMPNFRGTRLRNDVEYVIWAKFAETSRYTFHHHQMKAFNGGKQLGSVWAIPACGGVERLRDEHGRKLHSTQKPEALLERIITASSTPGDLVLDPFAGTGTTAAVAKRLRRRYLTIERDAKYIPHAQRRIDAVEPLPPDHPAIVAALRPRPRRVPFRRLLENAYVQPGQVLYLDKPDITATVQDDGRLRVEDAHSTNGAPGFTGSIHQTGAYLKGTVTCNGWKHWYFEDGDSGQRRPLDVLRQRLRERGEAGD